MTKYLSQTNSEYLQQKNMQRPAIPRGGGPPRVFIFIRSRTEAFVVLFRVLSRKKYGIKRHLIIDFATRRHLKQSYLTIFKIM